MLRRLLLGLLLGLMVGALLAVGIIGAWKHVTYDGALGLPIAYGAAALAGVLTGLVAGKPIWASGAQIEAGLKAFFGGLLGAAIMFALRQWVHLTVDFSALGVGGPAPVGQLIGASLPLVAATLGLIFELDNTGNDKPTSKAPPARPRVVVAARPSKAAAKRAAAEDEMDGAGDDLLPKSAKR